MLPEGSNKQAACRKNKIDKDDYFSLLMVVASYDTIGAVRIIKN
jgi:serine/threonine-protein kinase HipA